MVMGNGKNSPPPPVPELPGGLASGSDISPPKSTSPSEGVATRNQVGDAGKRFINHSLGRPHSGSNSLSNGKGSVIDGVSASLKGMTIQEANE